MNDVMPLLLLWLWSRSQGSAITLPPPPLPPGPPPIPTPLHEIHKQAKKKTPAPVTKPTIPAFLNYAPPGTKPYKPGPDLTNADPPQMQVSVADIQTIINKYGMRIKADHIYGPKTATAWIKLAMKHNLSPMINKVTPKIACVAIETFNKLRRS